jgi:site-specific DNA-methyltransferase (adenine-specific)
MRKLQANSVDMVCTDPPYFLDGLGADWSGADRGASSVVAKLPKGMKFDRKQSQKFRKFYSEISSEVFRVLKPGGAFLSFSSPRLYHALATAVEDAGFEIRDMIGWVYSQSQAKAFSQDHIIENDKTRTPEQKAVLKALCANWKTPQLKPAIEPICLAFKPIEGRFIDNFEAYGTGLMNTGPETRGEGGVAANVVTTEEIWEKAFLVPKPSKSEKGDYNTHISVKPAGLVAHLVTLFTRPGALVLDPFMGSGTAAVACVMTGRRYLGYETNAEYIKIAERRLAEIAV